MKLTLNDWHLQLIDRVRASGRYGTTREEVLNSAVQQHARYLAAGGTMFDQGDPGVLEVDPVSYGPLRAEHVIEPVTGKAVPVLSGEVLRISQVEGGTCVDYNAYNLHDYKEYLDCGFNRFRGIVAGRGAIVWTGSPRGRPMYVIADHSDRFEQYYQGHRCNGIMNEIDYGWVDHPNCQDTFAETIREYGLTPDDVHDSYNLWMRTSVTPAGRRQFHWNKAQKGDYVDLLAVMDTLSVPVICGGDISSLNNFDPRPIRLQVFAPSPSTAELVEVVRGRFGRFRSQQTPQDFKKRDILAQRELVADPNYVPDFIPTAKKTVIDVEISQDSARHLATFLATGEYLESSEHALLQVFFRWYEAIWPRTHYNTKLVFRRR
jgi:uncharacterized protein YcgI (DUF1989 family)